MRLPSLLVALPALLPACTSADDPSSGEDSGVDDRVDDTAMAGDSDTADTGDSRGGDTGDTGDTGDSNDSLPVCVSATGVQSPGVGTVVTVTWTSDSPGPSTVQFGSDTSYGRTTPGGSDAGTDHEVVVAGMPAGASWHWRVYTEVDGEPCVSEDHEVPATTAPADLPALTASGEPSRDWTVVGFGSTSGPYVLIVDGKGSPVWWWRGEAGEMTTQTRLSADRQAVVFDLASTTGDGTSQRIRRVSLDGLDVRDVETPDLHHDFLELPDGRYAYIATNIQNAEGAQVAGDDIRVVDPADGTIETVWSTWDEVPMEINYDEAYGFYPGVLDWTHGNGLAYDADTDSFYLSAKNVSEVYKVTAGALEWTLAGDGGDFTLVSGELFHGQHAPVPTPDGILLFSNGDKNATPPDSKVMAFTLDEDTRTVSEAWRYDFDQTVYVQLLGNAEPEPDGSLFVAMGDKAELRRVTPAGEELSRLTAPGVVGMSYAHSVAALGGALR